MANTRISDLTASASNLAASDLAPVVQTAGVGPVKMTGAQIAAGLLSATTPIGSGPILSRAAAATLQLGAADVATTAVAQTLQVQSNTGAANGPDFTIKGSNSGAANTGGNINFQLADAGAYSTQLYLRTDKVAVFGSSTSSAFNIQLRQSSSGITASNNGGANTARITGDRSGSGGGARIHVGSNAEIGWNDATTLTSSAFDTILTRGGAAATLQLGAADAAAPVAQTFKVQSVVGSTPGATDVAGANFTIQGSAGRGSGAGGSIIFQVAPAGSAGTGAQNAYSTALTITSARQLVVGGTGATVPSIVATAGATGGFGLNGPEPTIVRNNNIHTIFDSVGIDVQLSNGRVAIPSGGYFGISDVLLFRDTTCTLALRNGGTSGTPVPQTFNIYNYWASASDYERLSVAWSSNICFIRTNAAGSGTGTRQIVLGVNNGSQLALGTLTVGSWNIAADGVMQGYGNLLFGTDNTYDIGASGTTNRVRTIYSGGGYSAAAPTIKTADYSQGAQDYSLIFNGTGSITLTLLAAATYPGKILYVKTIAAQTVVSASSNVKPIDTDTAGTAILAATAGKWALLQSDGTNWVIMAQG